jgi:nitroimidazol reductase NimA-like FMN-containing flavoprotein (pyridoxamine 5'-phosphate oxidase superfamily)
MDESEVRKVLADPVAQRLISTRSLTRLGYIGRDGGARVVPIGYVWTGSAFVVCTSTNAAKVPALRADPRVALTIDTDEFPPNVLLVRATASIEIVDGIPQEFLDTTAGSMDAQQRAAWEAGVRKLYKQMARITLMPTWAKVLDFDTRLPTAVEELVRKQA